MWGVSMRTKSYTLGDISTKLLRMAAGTCPICMFDGSVTKHTVTDWRLIVDTKVMLHADLVCPKHGTFSSEAKL